MTSKGTISDLVGNVNSTATTASTTNCMQGRPSFAKHTPGIHKGGHPLQICLLCNGWPPLHTCTVVLVAVRGLFVLPAKSTIVDNVQSNHWVAC